MLLQQGVEAILDAADLLLRRSPREDDAKLEKRVDVHLALRPRPILLARLPALVALLGARPEGTAAGARGLLEVVHGHGEAPDLAPNFDVVVLARLHPQDEVGGARDDARQRPDAEDHPEGA